MPIIRVRATRAVVVAALAVALAGGSLALTLFVGPAAWGPEPPSPAAAAFGVRGAEKVKAAYAEWVKQHDANGGDRSVTIALGYWKALSTTYTQASGTAKLNLIDGAVSVTVSGLPTGEWDVWLIDQRADRSSKPEPADVRIQVGRLTHDGDTARLDAELGTTAFQEFHVDLVVVASAGSDPKTTGLLFGSPPLFQRLYTALRSAKLLMASDFASKPGIVVERRWASALGAPTAEADDTGIFVNENVVFDNLVAKGADLFLNETFKGNGRTCATCHRKEANFTIDVNFIAALDDDDALFVAEFRPALAFDPFGPKFEVPLLMRKHALIVENVDGMGDLVNRFAMRGTPHTLGMRRSLTPRASEAGVAPKQRTGWSGDGAPGDGTLRDFATGAVTQHFPKTLNRVNGADFVLPTDAELDAMEAFQLTLGRQVDPVLPLAFKDPQVLRGQALFIAPANAIGGGGGCHACHANGGATASFDPGVNRNFNTGVENQLDRPQVLTLQANNIDLTPGVLGNIIPRDGGFGQGPGVGPDALGFGDGTFNTPPVIEAADTGPFFHDNSITTIEGAVAFYNSAAFNGSPSGTGVNLQATQVEAIAAFLRVLNALDNIREATENANAAKSAARRNPQAADQLIKQALGDVLDAQNVLFARALHTRAQKFLDNAADNLRRASSGGGSQISIDRSRIDRAISDLNRARGDMI
jgi:cytochrome c peroxidase